jgi:hypothetical protein
MLVGCQLVSYLRLLVRGTARRDHPYMLLLGFSPRSWANALTLAASQLASALLLPLLVVLSVVAEDFHVLAGGLFLCAFACVTASIVGSLSPLATAQGGSEFAGSLIVLIVTFIAAQAAIELLGTSETLPVCSALLAVAAVASWLPGTIEQRRWHSTFGPPPAAPRRLGSRAASLEEASHVP